MKEDDVAEDDVAKEAPQAIDSDKAETVDAMSEKDKAANG